MGEIAEDLIDGSACSLCGQYFADPNEDDVIYTHGHPVVCKECWSGLDKTEKQIYNKAIVDTF